MKTVIKVACVDQTLQLTSTPVVASGGSEAVGMEFSFCPLWQGYTRTAMFWRTPKKIYTVSLDAADSCVIPAEVLQTEGVLCFGVYGDSPGGARRTAGAMFYRIGPGAVTEDMQPPEPTPDLYMQVLAAVANAQPPTDSLPVEENIADDDSLPTYSARNAQHRRITWGDLVAKLRARLIGSANGVLQADGKGNVTARGVDAKPTQGSDNLVTSGGVQSALQHSHALTDESLTGQLPIEKGGTGQASVSAAANAFGRGVFTCSAAADEQEKVYTSEPANSYHVGAGSQLFARFVNGNTHASPTLKVDDHPALPILRAEGTAPTEADLAPGRLVHLVYFGDAAWTLLNPHGGSSDPASGGDVEWIKYSCEIYNEYIHDNGLVGRTSVYGVAWGGDKAVDWEFDTSSGFSASRVEYRDAGNMVGTYYITATEVFVLTSLSHTEEQYDVTYYYYNTECVASATESDDLYRQGSTSYGKIYADEGEQPEAGNIIKQGPGFYIIQTADGVYWYKREG